MKKALLTILIATAMISTSAAAIISTYSAMAENEAIQSVAGDEIEGLRMVDGASIRIGKPLGLRFIAEMTEEVYTGLTTKEDGVTKKMGMIIVPYEYLSDATKFSGGSSDVTAKNYQNLTTKLDYVFYADDGSDVGGNIYYYEENGTYRANGVISDLKLKNYDREFVGIAYIARETSSKTTYSFTEIDEEVNVRSAAFVAIEAYQDYTDTYSRKVFSEYVLGAHLKTKGMTYNNGKYEYAGNKYDTITDAGANVNFTLELDGAYLKNVGDSAFIPAIIKDNGVEVTFNGAHAVLVGSTNKNVVTKGGNGKIEGVSAGFANLTANFIGIEASCKAIVKGIDFENETAVPSFMSNKSGRIETFAITEMYGSKVLQATTTASSTSDVGVFITTEVLNYIFANSDVDYMAFDLKSGATRTGSKVYYHGNGATAWKQYETGGYDSVPVDSFKTYYFPRSEYDNWVSKNVSQARFVMIGGNLVYGGESFYIDNIRPVTEEEKSANLFSFEQGGVRTNNGSSPLFYDSNSGSWEIALSNINSATAGFTSEIVSDGIRAYTFTKYAGDTAFTFNHNADTTMEKAMRNAGYVSYDLYVPVGSDAKVVNNNYYSPLSEGWNTVYARVDATSNEWSRINDTTASTYVIDNIRFVTEEEYYKNVYSFESGAGVLRTGEIGDNTTNKGVFYYYGGADATATFSFAFQEGDGTNDVAAISNPRFATDIVHDGNYSLAFDKGNGYMYLTMRNDSTAFSKLSGGFSFWIYSTTAIDGTTTSNFINGKNAKFNDGVGINIPANTWTQVFVTANDMNPTRFLIMQGKWSSKIYIDDIQPLDMSNLRTIAYDMDGDGEVDQTQTVLNGATYTLPTPDGYRDFMGWVDEKGNAVEMSGVWNITGNVTLTAIYSDSISFENDIVPTCFTKADNTESLSVVEMDTTDGNKALKIQASAGGTSISMKATIEFLASFFEDSNVDYIAFEAKAGVSTSNNFRRHTWRSNNGGEYVNVKYEADVDYTGIRADGWKTFYFSRTDYNHWLTEGTTVNYFISSGNMTAGDCIYVDNIRAATEEDYTNSLYSFDNGGLRIDGNNLLVYKANDGIWQWGVLPSAKLTSYGYTNEIVSDGVAAITFTPQANTSTLLRFNTSTTTQMQKDIMGATGYYAFDLYVPVGSDVKLTYNTTNYPGVTPKQGGWTTIYVNNSTSFVTISDTTGSSYVVDNFHSVTAEEYANATLGFEAGAGGLRDNVEASNVFYYFGGADHTVNRYSFAVTGSPLESVRYDGEVVHGGDYSLAFTKENGTINVQMRKDSTTYALLKNGFTFWIYSTVGINGVGANNFVNGNDQKFNGGAGMVVSANKWTQVTVTASDIKHATASDGACPFLKIQGSTAGTIYLDDFVALPYEEVETLEYNATVENEEDGIRSGVLFGASSHTVSTVDALPQNASDTEDMSYVKFGGTYGLNDFLVFDFTGDNMPLMSFFTTEVTNSVYNQEENAEMKGWIVANGMTTKRGLPYSGTTSNLANRLNIIGPYKISNLYDNTTGNTLAQVRTSEGNAANPSPITMPTLQANGEVPYRAIVGWVANGNYMNLVMVVYDLSSGKEYLNYNLNKSIAKADWEGDIALYGHFYRETYVDAIYPIEEDTTIEDVIAKYKPTTIVYNGTWDEDGALTLNASTHVGATSNVPLNSGYKEDMSYIAFDGTYGLNDYVVFDFTGDNFPFVSFFNTEISNTIFNFANDKSIGGWIIANGIKSPNGNSYGGDTGAHANRILFVGSNKITYRYDDNGSTGQWRTSIGSASSPSPIAITPLKSVKDTYRAIIGYVDNGGNGAKAIIYVVNMVTGAVVVNYSQALANPYTEGSIILYGQFGTGTVLDKVFGVEEDTTLDALKAKYAKGAIDYSGEPAVTLDRYAYSSLSNGQWTLDGSNQVANPTDFRLEESAYETYKNAGFNIVLAQDMIGTDGSQATWEASANKTYMDNAYNAGLRVILTDWHLQILSAPLKVSSAGVVKSDSTYVPWIIGTDASATTGEAANYLSYLSSLGITADTTRFKTRDDLDKFVYEQLAPYMNHPAFYGVMLADEPSYHNAYCYGEIYKSIKRVMPKCYVQYNLLPLEQNFSTIRYRYPGVNSIGSGISNAQIETAYISYVESFLDTMGTDYIQYDDYPFKSAEEGILFWKETVPYVDNTSLRNIQIMAEIAKKRNLDVKVVTQSSVMRSGGSDGPIHIRQITENDARWLNNYLMGFGVKQINYFTYWTKASSSSSGEYFVDGGSFVNRNGTTTALYDFMKTIMADNTKFAPTIFNFDYKASQIFGSDNGSQNNDHISWSSSLTAAASFRFVKGVTTSLEYTLVTELFDKDNYNYMYMVMNTIDPNYGGTQSITVTLDSSVTKFYVYDQSGNRTEQTGNTYTVSLTAGQAIYIMPCAF